MLGAASLPITGAGLVLMHGLARWLLLSVATGLVTIGAVVSRRETKRHEGLVMLALTLGICVIWSWALPAEGLLQATGLVVGMVYLGLMAPRPFAKIGIIASAVTFAALHLAFEPAGRAFQIGTATTTALSMGLLTFCIRITTERRVNEHTRSLADLNARLEQLSRIDPLTGLANRRQLGDVLAEAWERAEAAGRPVAAIMIDVDFFKQYNDHFGHRGGDDCLQLIAAAVAGGTRANDTVARYGGEEIAVILPDTDLECAHRTAERIRAAVVALKRPHPSTPAGFVTVSIGVAAAVPGQDHAGSEDLLQGADRCLYEAKRSGRSRSPGSTRRTPRRWRMHSSRPRPFSACSRPPSPRRPESRRKSGSIKIAKRRGLARGPQR